MPSHTITDKLMPTRRKVAPWLLALGSVCKVNQSVLRICVGSPAWLYNVVFVALTEVSVAVLAHADQ